MSPLHGHGRLLSVGRRMAVLRFDTSIVRSIWHGTGEEFTAVDLVAINESTVTVSTSVTSGSTNGQCIHY